MKRAELIEKWLQALESGDYKQGREKLRMETDRGFKYCCLGVACQLLENNGKNVEWNDGYNETLPESVVKFMGIECHGQFVKSVKHNGELYGSLVSLNDAGVRFKTIARIIREQMEKKNFEKP